MVQNKTFVCESNPPPTSSSLSATETPSYLQRNGHTLSHSMQPNSSFLVSNDVADITSKTVYRTGSHDSPEHDFPRTNPKLVGGSGTVFTSTNSRPVSTFDQHVIIPMSLHTLIPLPMLTLQPHGTPVLQYLEQNELLCALTVGPILTGISSLIHHYHHQHPQLASSLSPSTRRTQYQFIDAASWAGIGLGYIHAFYTVVRSPSVSQELSLWIISQGLLFIVILYWVFGVANNFIAAGRRFDLISRVKRD
ncbi:hypothetical protein SISSUDRAFT_128768 [Sistotremastrum suecicum HHB10207 ss-3]|uniref:Uncharacterized protein n=1 Tax=Sistotremastrum suecicum HHB10207 ss-3 TaxID=1314776 RepID=A0A166AWQ6_9AGAM|nr:hypothetical protein SISSUDRAFT_128768 [Sistotremastrum suecicum HHB10207 ss-3]